MTCRSQSPTCFGVVETLVVVIKLLTAMFVFSLDDYRLWACHICKKFEFSVTCVQGHTILLMKDRAFQYGRAALKIQVKHELVALHQIMMKTNLSEYKQYSKLECETYAEAAERWQYR